MVPVAGLEQRQRQVLRFVATYADERGCLPTAAEVALGCGIGSHGTVLRVLRELERLGVIERDPAYPRLGIVHAQLPTCRLDGELFLTELSVVESRGNLDVLRAALAWAPDADAIGFLHREGSARATLLRAYEDARRRLVDAGVTLAPAARAWLADMPGRIRARHGRLDGWESYCLYSTVITLCARRMTTALEAVGLPHLEPVYVTESVVYDLDARLDRVVAADFALRRPELVHDLVVEFVAAFELTFAGIHAVFDRLALPPLGADRAMRAIAELGTLVEPPSVATG